MKYSQYHELRELFENDHVQSMGYTFESWKNLDADQKIEELNEASRILNVLKAATGFALAGGASLLGLNKNIRKNLMTWGIKGSQMKKLNKLADEFKGQATAALKKAYAQLVKAKNDIKENAKVDSFEKLPDDKKDEVIKIEKQIVKVFNQTIDKLSNLKTQQVEKAIDNNTNLSDEGKIGLKFAWETMAVEAKVALLADLMKSKVIETEQVSGLLDDAMEKKGNETKKKAQGVFGKMKGGKKSDGEMKKGEVWEAQAKNKDIKYRVEIIEKRDDGTVVIREEGKEKAPTKELSPKEAKKALKRKIKEAPEGEPK